MSREIRFRAWDTIDSEWKYSGYPHMPMWKFWENVELNGGYENVCQYTNLKDKNGKEIYEGDIVRVPYYGDMKTEVVTIGEITSHQETYECFPFNSYQYSESGYDEPSQAEVIGNKFEHPHLLKQEGGKK